jgi:type II secretory pathway pseudopilin PulG
MSKSRTSQCRALNHSVGGFSLVEMAIVIAIITLLLGAVLVPLSTQVEQRSITSTQQSLDEIKEALIGFALANGRLPCPADPTIATGQPNAGIERTTCIGIDASGVIPWVTLGVGETDAWGRRFTYRVTDSFADAISAHTVTPPITCTDIPAQSSFALCSLGSLTITVDGVNPIASYIPAIIISHGKNGYGAYTSSGTQISTTDASANEKENADGTTDNIYVSRTYSTDFDDIVTWISPNVLFNRMVAAGKLP